MIPIMEDEHYQFLFWIYLLCVLKGLARLYGDEFCLSDAGILFESLSLNWRCCVRDAL